MTAIKFGVLIRPLQKYNCPIKMSSVLQLLIAPTRQFAVTQHPVTLAQLFLTNYHPTVTIMMWHVV